MKHVSILILIFLACLFAGCADEPIDSPEGLPEKGIVVRLTTGQLDTKTHLYSQASLHHVTRIYAILYYCGDMTADDIVPEKNQGRSFPATDEKRHPLGSLEREGLWARTAANRNV